MPPAPKTLNLGNVAPDVFPPLTALGQPEPQWVPASVLSSWDTLRTALGRTVPANVTRAKLHTGRLMRAVH